MRIAVGAGVTDPIVLDTNAVELFLGTATFASDTTTEFSTNQSRFRLESPVLLVVRRADGTQVVGSS
jgi:hypothetical protein